MFCLARDNPRWDYQRIVGELKSVGMAVSATTVRMWLRQEGLGRAGTRGGMTWRDFRRSMLAVDFFTFRAPQANSVAERFVRTVRSECLDWLLILNDQHLARVLDVFVDHYNGHRPHRGLALTPPQPTRPPVAPKEWGEARVLRRDPLGGVVREYVLAA